MKRKICLALVCGVPATGKTTVCESIVESSSLSSAPLYFHLSFDRLYNERYGAQQWRPDLWRQCQTDLYRLVEHGVLWLSRICRDEACPRGEHEGGHPCWMCDWWKGNIGTDGTLAQCSEAVLLVDDNMHYRSMRYRYVQLARKMGLYCCVMAIRADSVDQCLQRNAERSHGGAAGATVPDDTIRDMFRKMEYPDERDQVGQHVAVVSTQGSLSSAVLRLQHLIGECLSDPSGPLQIPSDQEKEQQLRREKSRQELLESRIHQLDIATRQEMTLIMKSKSVLGISKTSRAAVAKNVNTARRKLLEDIRLQQRDQLMSQDQEQQDDDEEWVQNLVQQFRQEAQSIVGENVTPQ